MRFKPGRFPKAVEEARRWIAQKKQGDYSAVLARLLVRALEGDAEAGQLLSERQKYFSGSDGAEGDAEGVDSVWALARETGCRNKG